MNVQLLIVQGKARGQYLRFPEGEFIFGRGPECHVRPNSEWVSRQHCLLQVNAEDVRIRDLGSANGTLVNGARVVGERALLPGDQLQVGPLVLQFVFGPDDLPAASAQEFLKDDTLVGLRDTAVTVK